MRERCFRWSRLEYRSLCVGADEIVITIDDNDNYYATMNHMSIDSTITVTVIMTIIEDVYLDCSIVKRKTLCTTASTSIQGCDYSYEGGYRNYPEPISTHGYGSYSYHH